MLIVRAPRCLVCPVLLLRVLCFISCFYERINGGGDGDLTPPRRGTPTNIPINLTFPETRIIGLHCCRW